MTRLWPRSLPVWILLIVVLALAAAQGATLLSARQQIARANNATDLFELGERTMALARDLQDRDAGQRNDFLENIKGTTISGEFGSKPAISAVVAADDELAEMEDLLMARLATEGVLDLRIGRLAPHPAAASAAQPAETADAADDVALRLSAVSNGLASAGRFLVAMQLSDHSWFNFSVPITPTPSLLGHRALPIYLAISGIVFGLCIWAVAQLTAPYRYIERAVTRIASDLNAPRLVETGSREAKATIRAVNRMQSQLRDYVADRENLAAALAHDLRTPLTRLKLRTELMRASKDRQLLTADIDQLEAIVASVVDFASVTSHAENASRVEVLSLLETICDDFPGSATLQDGAGHRVVVSAHPVQLTRCIRNLVENAIRYAGSATLSVREDGDAIEIRVDDNGPGIAPDMLTEVVKPFVRLETSRNQAFGGTGLGLAIAEQIARLHGGSLTLENRKEGGLSAIVRLPRAPLASPA